MSITTTRMWDYGSRLRSIANVVNGATVTSHAYNYDAINRRTRATLEDGSMWNYGYDDRNELTSATRDWSDWSPVSGQQYGYAYDNIGNRQSASYGGDTSGRNLQTINYGANSLNEYTNVATPGWQEVVGAAITSNSVTVNGGWRTGNWSTSTGRRRARMAAARCGRAWRWCPAGRRTAAG